MHEPETIVPPSALMLLGPGCPHCAGVFDALGRLLKEGVIGRLEVINVAVHPEAAAERGVRSVPWVSIGSFELAGTRTLEELRGVATEASRVDGAFAALERLLAEGGLARAQALLAREPHHLPQLVARIADPDTPLQVRLGIDAIMEETAAAGGLGALLPLLVQLSAHGDRRVRADACHYLGLTGQEEARPALEAALSDPDAEVREIAQEALQSLGAT